MCKVSIFINIFFYIYNVIWIGVPILYLIMFKLYKSNNKVYVKAFIYALIMCLVLYIPKLVGYLFPESCYNCAMNHVCIFEEEKEDTNSKEVINMNNSTTKKTTSTTTTTTTKKAEELKTETSKGYKIVTINGATYINDILIVNKTYPVTKDFVPKNTYKNASGYSTVCNDCIDNETYEAWTEMKADAQAVGLNLWIQSGYRPYVLQEKLYNNYVKRDGKKEADRYSARAGYSEHQTALCFDINNPSKSFNGTVEAKWINDNCYKYGFIIRYPEGKEDETGYMYESWHVRYVGKDLAKKLYNDGDWITLESYLGITSEYAD